MKPERCPCCQQIIPPELIFENAPVKQRIYDFIASHQHGVTRNQIFEHVYPGEDGGPESLSVVSVHLGEMRDLLSQRGLEIRSSFGPGAKYKLKARLES